MIPRTLNDITEEDLTALISNAVREGRTIDYKRALPGNSDAEKKEFLADVSSFANTAGGDLVFGMDEVEGVPTQVTGIQSTDLDADIRRLDSILASGLSPRIRYLARIITTHSGDRLLIVRIDRSWGGPHRVVFQGHDKFYGRNSAGKYPLDVNELRAAFTLSSTTVERIRAFRTDRIIALSNNETPLPFVTTPKVVLHCIPVQAFGGDSQYDLRPLRMNPLSLAPMGTTRWNHRSNLEGVLSFGTHEICFSYTQIYRNGIVEVVQGNILSHEHDGRQVIPSISYEQYILGYLPHCFHILQTIGANPPVIVALTLIDTKGLHMGVRTIFEEEGYPIIAQNIVLPEVMVDAFDTPPSRILKPLFDIVWNACGFPQSGNFDEAGNWCPRR
jgi:hypothetical protein